MILDKEVYIVKIDVGENSIGLLQLPGCSFSGKQIFASRQLAAMFSLRVNDSFNKSFVRDLQDKTSTRSYLSSFLVNSINCQ